MHECAFVWSLMIVHSWQCSPVMFVPVYCLALDTALRVLCLSHHTSNLYSWECACVLLLSLSAHENAVCSTPIFLTIRLARLFPNTSCTWALPTWLLLAARWRLTHRPALVEEEDVDFSSPPYSFVLTLFIFKAPNYVLARTLTERVV